MAGPKKVGRPTLYSEALAKLICDRIVTHEYGLKRLCEMYDDMPEAVTITRWRLSNKEFSTQYDTAKRFQTQKTMEEVQDWCDVPTFVDDKGVERVDGGRASVAKLKVDTMKWTAARLLPHVYGDKDKEIEKLNETNANLVELVAKLTEKYKSDV